MKFSLSNFILFILLLSCAMTLGFEHWQYLKSIEQRKKLQEAYYELEHAYAVKSRHYIMIYEAFETRTGSILGYQMMPRGKEYDDLNDHLIESTSDDREVDLTPAAAMREYKGK